MRQQELAGFEVKEMIREGARGHEPKRKTMILLLRFKFLHCLWVLHGFVHFSEAPRGAPAHFWPRARAPYDPGGIRATHGGLGRLHHVARVPNPKAGLLGGPPLTRHAGDVVYFGCPKRANGRGGGGVGRGPEAWINVV